MNLEEALLSKTPVTELEINKEEIVAGLPEKVSQFTELKKLEIQGAADGTLAFPKILLSLPIEQLKLTHFRAHEIFELKQLKKLQLWNHYTQDDILPICNNLKQLKSLEIYGYNAMRSLMIPSEIKNLTDLEELNLDSCAMTELPNELADLTKLKTLRLCHQSFTEFPLVITSIPNLTHLEVNRCQLITSLPDELANLQSLRYLNLSDMFRGKVNLSFEEEMDELMELWDDEKEIVGFSIPNCICKLSNLEHLEMENAHLTNIDGIGKLNKLMHLNLGLEKKITDISAVEKLTVLEELNLSNNTYLSDLKPLNDLFKLRKLNLENLNIKNIDFIVNLNSLIELNIKGCRDLSSITPLLKHPTLTKLKAEKDVLEHWEKRHDFVEVNKDSIKILLQSENLQEVEKGIILLTTYLEFTGTKRKNPLYDFFDIDKRKYGEEKMVPINELNTLLHKFENELSTESLIQLIKSTLSYNIYDNFEATLLVAAIFIKRKDVVGQNVLIECFKEACEYYDAGHRFFSSTTVQDQLLDDLFPQFEGEPLVNLLTWCEDDYLYADNGLDGMDNLFKPAFEKIKNNNILENKLLQRFEDYVLNHADEGLDASYIEDFQVLEGFEAASTKVQEIISKWNDSILSKSEKEEEEENPLTSNENNNASNSPSNKTIEDVVKTIIAEQLGITIEKIVPEASINSGALLIDELDRVEILMAIEDEYSLEFATEDDENMSQLNTVNEFILYIEQLVGKANSSDNSWMRQDDFNNRDSDEFISTLFDDSKITANETIEKIDGYEPLGDNTQLITNYLIANFETLKQSKINEILQTLLDEFTTIAESESIFLLIKQLPEIKNITLRDELISSIVYNTFNSKLRAQNLDDAHHILEAYVTIIPQIGRVNKLGLGKISNSRLDVQQAFASDAVVLAVYRKNESTFNFAHQLVPEHISEAVLAFNLCCWYAVNNNKEKLLHYTKLALNLGKKPREFINDSDFIAYLSDPDFLEIIDY